MISRRFVPCAVTLASLLIALPSGRAADAETAAPTEGLRANAENIEDLRSSMAGRCRIGLVFFGDDMEAIAGVLGLKATKAVDDLDRDLLQTEGGGVDRVLPLGRFARIGGLRTPLRGTVTLRNPSRRSTTIKILEGTAVLFAPSVNNEGLVRLSRPLASPDVPLGSPVLTKYQIGITYISEEKAAELRRTTSAALNAEDEQRRLEAVAAEVARRRSIREQTMTPGAPTQTALPAPTSIPPSTATYVTTPISSAGRIESKRVTFQVVDPDRRVVGLEWQDAEGNPLEVSLPYTVGALRSFSFTNPPPSDAQLVVYVASDGAKVTRPFHVENIALP